MPDFLEISRLLASGSALIVTIGSYDQVWRIWKNRTVENISPALIWLSFVNELTWLNYGIALREWPMILIGVINFPACVGAVWGYLAFRRKR